MDYRQVWESLRIRPLVHRVHGAVISLGSPCCLCTCAALLIVSCRHCRVIPSRMTSTLSVLDASSNHVCTPSLSLSCESLSAFVPAKMQLHSNERSIFLTELVSMTHHCFTLPLALAHFFKSFILFYFLSYTTTMMTVDRCSCSRRGVQHVQRL